MMTNLMDGILFELDRNRKLLKEYERIGPSGIFGVRIITEKALVEEDVVQMVACYKNLKETE